MGAEGDCEELSLELSIGGKYAGKSENLGDKTRGFCGENANCESRCDFSESIDLQKRRGTQASRRLEARRKRKERVRKSRGVNNVVGFVDDKLFLEAQRFGERARDREIREKELFYEGKNGGGEAADELRLSLFSDDKEKKRGNGCLYTNVQLAEATSDSENSNGVKPLEKCSSAMSDYLSMSQKGGSSSDAGSHDSAETERCHKSKASWMTSPEGEGTNMSSTAEALSSGGEAPKASPRLPHMQMPCVSATGDGPNGRRVLGFLYKYDKREVSIMCVCHGSSFSPAEFVEHAGGVDVSHPLRHITLVTS